MSTTQHTPGPWRIRPPRTIYEANSGERIESASGAICRAETRRYASDLTSEAIPEGERQANARLIAAAPDLLLQLQRLERVARDTIGADGALIMACDNAAAAIAKATQSPASRRRA